jgi:hypothetical protein
LWQLLHQEINATPKWFEEWKAKIPSYGCDCKRWFDDWLKDNQPVYGDGWYDWTVLAHNAVNKKLSKPIWTKPD